MKKVTRKATATRKTSVVKKVKTFLTDEKATAKWALKKVKSAAKLPKSMQTKRKKTNKAPPESLYMNVHPDPAHSPGHRTMNLKKQFKKEHTGPKTQPQNESARNHMTRAAGFKRTAATNRRIITGAAVGKTGQIVIK